MSDTPPGAVKLASSLTWAAAVAFCVVTAGLFLGAGLPLVDAVLLSVLLAVVPLLAMAQVPLAHGLEIPRIPAYWSSIVTLGVVGAASWFVGSRDAGMAGVGLVSLPLSSLLAWTCALTVAGLAIIVAFRAAARSMGALDSDLLVQLLPTTDRERGVFALLSVAAGTGEELAYRGYVIPALTPVVGVVGAAVLSTAVFGVVHAYQGVLGIFRTALMGGVLAWGFLASGSLWPAILAHILIDLIAGIAVGERLLVKPSEVS
ncbi:MAG: CPBP family intramembrane metalloprotease [Gemmatimonadetes bacterium]|nr:CPBP family intramembrane metalloprotease [Gemmatimonadota bacterium]